MSNTTDYFSKHDYVSASLLKALSSDPKQAKAMLDGERKLSTEALTFGSLFDAKVTTPDIVADTYHILESPKPTDKMLNWANEVIDIKSMRTSDIFENNDIILLARDTVGYDPRLKSETAINKFKDSCEPYVEEVLRVKHEGKILITQEEDLLSDNMKTILLQHNKAGVYFTETEGRELNFQKEFYWQESDFEAKALLDVLEINRIDKTIRGVDLKSYEGNFMTNFYKYKYYYQAAWYQRAVERLVRGNSEYLEYTILPFLFIACDKSLYKNPAIYTMSHRLLEQIYFGGAVETEEMLIGDRRPIINLLHELRVRQTNDNWSDVYEMMMYGSIPIDKL